MKALALLPLLAVPVLATPAQATPAGCAAYRYTGSSVSLCADFPAARDKDCPEIRFQVTLVARVADPWSLDRDGDGKGCDDGTYPTRPASSPSPSKSIQPSPSSSPSRQVASSPTPSRSASPTLSRSTSPMPSPSESAAPELARTGPSAPLPAGVAGGIVLAGAGLALLARRRRARFEA